MRTESVGVGGKLTEDDSLISVQNNLYPTGGGAAAARCGGSSSFVAGRCASSIGGATAVAVTS